MVHGDAGGAPALFPVGVAGGPHSRCNVEDVCGELESVSHGQADHSNPRRESMPFAVRNHSCSKAGELFQGLIRSVAIRPLDAQPGE